MADAYRFQLSRTAGWRKPAGGISCARPHRWSNPYRVADHGREEAVRLYEQDLIAGQLVVDRGRRSEKRVGVEDVRRELAGKPLGCFCRLDLVCHVDVLVRMANF